MACPRCGCRMVTKLGSGNASRLLCSDCGLEQAPVKAMLRSSSHLSQLITIGLITLFGLTAAGLMTLSDQQNPSLRKEDPLNLDKQTQMDGTPHRKMSVLPRSSTLRD